MSNRHMLYWRNALSPTTATGKTSRHHSHSARDEGVFERRRARLAKVQMRAFPGRQHAAHATWMRPRSA